MRRPIPLDATEVIYHPPYGKNSIVVKVVRHTPTTVQIERSDSKFRRKDGYQQGNDLSRSHISEVTPEALDQIEADKLYVQVEALHKKIREQSYLQVTRRIEATKQGQPSLKSADCLATIAALKELLAQYEQP